MKERRGVTSEHDLNRLEGRVSREVMGVLQRESGVGLTTKKNRHMSIHLAMDRHTEEEIKMEERVVGKVGLGGQKLNLSEIFPDVYSAWGYPGDASVKYDIYDLEKKKVQELGGVWK